MKREDRYQFIVDYFSRNQPDAETELQFSTPYELLVAVVLSAQCTDKRVNLITPALFRRFPDAEALAQGSVDEIFSYIRSVSYPNNKAKHLAGLGQMLRDQYHSEVPSSVDELQKLPGVGRKTANVIASVIYNQPTMAVDTHVFRVSKRIGLVNQNAKTPLAVELQLYRYLSKDVIPKAHHWLILHGRYVCMARNPQCAQCGIQQACRYFEQNLGTIPNKD
ncbi:MAG TPA: endonuclease III [Catalimonadaceae bacterium]|nr:endonuclease III [Catalimonadaceae bacterium]